MPERVRRLEIDEAGDGQQRRVELLARQDDGESRLRGNHHPPGSDAVDAIEEFLSLRDHALDEGRIELRARPPLGYRPSGVHASRPVCNLEKLRQLRDPSGDRDGLARRFSRPAPPVPTLVGPAHRVEYRYRQAELLPQRPRQAGVLSDHVVDLAVPTEGELEPRPNPMQGLVPGSEPTEHPGGFSQAERLVM